ncbi:MAG: metallophosphoesterase family protein [Clostridia bacterium]|nr:metallophosphoesterase family protein [Clostridia bacterium]
MLKRICLLVLSALLVLSLFPAASAAEDAEKNWWEQDIWPTETLLSLGARLPDYNASEARYEISTPEQLLYLSGLWKPEDTNGDGAPDAPCNGTYVLTADLDMTALLAHIGAVITENSGIETKGYMPPIAALADEAEDGGVKCAFFGTFDGQGHVIQNLRIVRMGDKYVGLFGNIGHDFGQGYVRNLAILDAEIKGLATCGILAGGVYGDIDNVVCTGTIDCAEKNAGGLAGKIKRNDNGYYGVARNCFVYCDILVRGEGGENGAVGGVSASNSKGGQIINCYVGGSIKVLGTDADSVAGIVGNLKGGIAIDKNVMLLKSIDAGKKSTNVGYLCGNYSGDTGSHLHDNIVWEGTRLLGVVSSDHPEGEAFRVASAETIRSKSLYADTLGWDFDSTWTWIGEESSGYPMLTQFADRAAMEERIASDLIVARPVLRPSEPMTNSAFEGDAVKINAAVLLPEGEAIEEAKLYYGTDKTQAGLKTAVPMTMTETGLSGELPALAVGRYYYYYTVEIDDDTYRFPSDGTLRLDVISASSKYAPEQLTLSPGETYAAVGFNWMTEADGLSSELRCRKAGASAWEITVPVTEIERVQVRGDHGTFTSYSVDLDGLEPDTAYEYMAVTNDGTRDYPSKIYSFKTLPDDRTFSFIVISDLQATNEEGYLAYRYTNDTFLADELQPDFVANVGDLTEDDTMSEWRFMYDTIGDIYATQLTAFAPGNHEGKGDVVYSHFKGRTNLPGGIDDAILHETTGSFVVGDVCFVILNTDPYTGIEGADASADKLNFYQAQKEWAKEVFEASGCTWRVILAHAGLIQKDPAATAFLEQMCDELDVNLFFNGHIHNYYRATVDGEGNAKAVGEATTFVTTSPMGPKFDDYEGELDDVLQFQTGGSFDPRQYLTYVQVTPEGVTVTGYQRSKAGDATKANCKAYDVIDTFTLTAPDSPAVDEPADAVPDKPVADTTAEAAEAPAAPTAAPIAAETVPARRTTGRTFAIAAIAVTLAVFGVVIALVVLRNKKHS